MIKWFAKGMPRVCECEECNPEGQDGDEKRWKANGDSDDDLGADRTG